MPLCGKFSRQHAIVVVYLCRFHGSIWRMAATVNFLCFSCSPHRDLSCAPSHARLLPAPFFFANGKGHGKDHAAVGLAALDERNDHRRQGRCLEAERCFVDALRLCAEVGGEECEGIGDISLLLGEMYCKIGKYAEALTELHKGLQIYFSIKGERSQDAGRALVCVGYTLRE